MNEETEFTPKKCLRCGYKWIPRKYATPPICPRCKTKYWDKKKIRAWEQK